MTSAARIKALVDEVVRLGNVMRRRDGLDDELAVTAGPADEAALAQVRSQLAGRVPPSFVTLLAIYDGIARFEWLDVSIHGARHLCAHPMLDADYELTEWAALSPYCAGSIFVFGEGELGMLLGFLVDEPDADGELPVMLFDAKGPIWRFPTLVTYLEGRLAWFQQHAA